MFCTNPEGQILYLGREFNKFQGFRGFIGLRRLIDDHKLYFPVFLNLLDPLNHDHT